MQYINTICKPIRLLFNFIQGGLHRRALLNPWRDSLQSQINSVFQDPSTFEIELPKSGFTTGSRCLIHGLTNSSFIYPLKGSWDILQSHKKSRWKKSSLAAASDSLTRHETNFQWSHDSQQYFVGWRLLWLHTMQVCICMSCWVSRWCTVGFAMWPVAHIGLHWG